MAKLPAKWRKKPVARTRSGAARKAWKTRRRRYGPSGVQRNSALKPRRVRWKTLKSGERIETYADTGRRTGRKARPGVGAVFYTGRRARRNQIFGLPLWAVLAGAALGLFLLTRKAAAAPAASAVTVMPEGGWSYPPMTQDTFVNWCKVNGGVQSNRTTCMISGKGVYTLFGDPGRLKSGDQWVLNDPELF